MKHLNVYTDGSFDKGRPEYTYGAFCCPDINISKVFKTSVTEATSMWNVGGELLAAICAVTFITKLAETLEGSNEELAVNLYYDYEGVGKWAKKEWKAKKPLTKAYVDFVRAKLNTHQNLKVNFIWIKGHNGTSGNEMADELAYAGLSGKQEADNMNELINKILGR